MGFQECRSPSDSRAALRVGNQLGFEVFIMYWIILVPAGKASVILNIVYGSENKNESWRTYSLYVL